MTTERPQQVARAMPSDQRGADAVVALDGVAKHYGSTRAVDGVDLVVRREEIVGFAGPNGSGKTTTLEMIAGLRRPTRGTVRVFADDPLAGGPELRARMSIQPQHAELFPNLTAAETLRLWASFYPQPTDPDQLLRSVGLADSADTRVQALSGGQQRRLLVATALVGGPQLAILDEPSTGLDPNARTELWELLVDVRQRGTTILLATHSMEEAESLCDRVAIMDRGRLVAEGPPADLIRRHVPEQVVTLARDDQHDPDDLRKTAGVARVDVQGNRVLVHTTEPTRLVEQLLAASPPAREVSVRTANLTDVFRRLTDGDTEWEDL